MSVNLTGNVNSSTINKIKVLKPIIKEAKHYGPHIDATDGALLRDRNASDAITASMSPMINKTLEFNQDSQINIQNWKVNLDIEFNKPENAGIKRDFNKIKKNLDYSKMPVYSKDKLQEVIKNLKNRRKWVDFLSGYEDNKDLSRMLLQKMDDENNKSILTCFGVNRKNNLPVFNEDVFDITVRTLTKNDLSSFMNNYNKIFEYNEAYNQVMEDIYTISTVTDSEDFKDYKGIVTSFNSWQPELEKLKKSENIKDIRILKLIIDNFKKSLKDLKFVMPVFNEDVFNKVKEKYNAPSSQVEKILNEYKKEYIIYLAQKYSLKNEQGKSFDEDKEFYCLDFMKDEQNKDEILNAIMLLSSNGWCTKAYNFAESHYNQDDNYLFFVNKRTQKTIYGGNYRKDTKYMEHSTENNDQGFEFSTVLEIINMLKFKNLPLDLKFIQHLKQSNLDVDIPLILMMCSKNEDDVKTTKTILEENHLCERSLDDLIKANECLLYKLKNSDEIEKNINLWSTTDNQIKYCNVKDLYEKFYENKMLSVEEETAESVFQELQAFMKLNGATKKEGEEYKDKEVYFDENDARLLYLDWILNYYE